MLVTLFLTVFVDLFTAVAVGLILAGFATARWMEREELKISAGMIRQVASTTKNRPQIMRPVF